MSKTILRFVGASGGGRTHFHKTEFLSEDLSELDLPTSGYVKDGFTFVTSNPEYYQSRWSDNFKVDGKPVEPESKSESEIKEMELEQETKTEEIDEPKKKRGRPWRS